MKTTDFNGENLRVGDSVVCLKSAVSGLDVRGKIVRITEVQTRSGANHFVDVGRRRGDKNDFIHIRADRVQKCKLKKVNLND